MYDHYPSLRGCVRDCCRRFIERWRKSASYRSEPAEEKSGKKHLLSLSFSSFLFFSLSSYLPLSFSFNICFLFFIVHIYISRVRTSHFSYESCIFVSIAPIDSKLSTRFYDDGCVFMNIRYFFFIFSLLPYLLLISSICIPRSVFVFSSSFFFLSSFPLSVAPFLSPSLFLSVSVSSSFSVISRGELRLPTYARLAVLSRTRERNERRSASHYQNSNVLLFSILQIESKYKIASSSINNLYRKNTKG